jgi:hypothetical protein|tara:strand:+ start:301 stop:549 length:249 start_codon:yes stop_codon:yes gene_type:complete
MALTERKEISQRTVLADGQIQVREDTVIERDGVEISRTYHRHVLAPGDAITAEDPSVQRIAMAEHTPAKIAAYKAASAETTH